MRAVKLKTTRGLRSPLEGIEENGLSRRVEIHDRNQLELKLGYTLDPRRKSETYAIETYIFMPRTLGIGSHNYSKSHFYGDTSAFIRFQTPRVALSHLADRASAQEWFDPIAILEEGLEDNLKVLACVYRSAIRSSAGSLRAAARKLRRLRPSRLKEGSEWLATELADFVQLLEQAHSRWQALRIPLDKGAGEGPRRAFAITDEYVALVLQDVVVSLLVSIDKTLDRIRLECGDASEPLLGLMGARDIVAGCCVRVDEYSQLQGHGQFGALDDLDDETNNEYFPYRRRLLKRAVFSPLYLEARGATSARVAHNLAGMLAAALAMAFAVGMAVWSQIVWGIMTWPFVLIAIGSYMVKDRIKEWGRSYLPRRFKQFFPDHAQVIEAFDRRKLGLLKERFEMKDPVDCDAEILAARYRRRQDGLGEEARPEVVLAYDKQVTLTRWSEDNDAFSSKFVGVHDIIRFNLDRFRSRMDDPEEPLRRVDPETLEVINVPTSRVYHVNIVLRYAVGAGDNAQSSLERIRIIVDQRGIKRVEEVAKEPKGFEPFQESWSTLG